MYSEMLVLEIYEKLKPPKAERGVAFGDYKF